MAERSDNMDVETPPRKFDGVGFMTWKQEMSLFLSSQKLDEFIKQDKPIIPGNTQDILCKAWILGCLTDKLYYVYRTAQTARELWMSLEDEFRNELHINTIEWVREEKIHEDSSKEDSENVYVPSSPEMPKPPIYDEDLELFEKQVRRIPPNISFEKAWEIYPLQDFFYQPVEPKGIIRKLFEDIRRSTEPPLKMLRKRYDQGRFVVPCSIQGTSFKNTVCDTGACTSVISRADADRIGLSDIRESRLDMTLADGSIGKILGTTRSLVVQIGSAFIPTDFAILDSEPTTEIAMVLGRPFLSSVGAIFDMTKARVCFSYVDETVFYKSANA